MNPLSNATHEALTSLSLRGADLLTLGALSPEQLLGLLNATRTLKADWRNAGRPLADKHVAMIFEKPSLRTRVSFEVAVNRLGGSAVSLDTGGTRLGERESAADQGRNLERMVDAIVARVYSQAELETLARAAKIPVVNALSDWHHPCQGLADCFTLLERFGHLKGLSVAYIGDGNNVCHSLMEGAALLGIDLRVITPPRCEPLPEIVASTRALAAKGGGMVTISHDAVRVEGCAAIYTDTWTSMGQRERVFQDADARRRAFEPYKVDAKLMARARPDAVFMHCLPAHRGVEVTDEVMDSPASVVFIQAENRLHVQTTLLAALFA
jgi:ornithine carbamoyltransferase